MEDGHVEAAIIGMVYQDDNRNGVIDQGEGQTHPTRIYINNINNTNAVRGWYSDYGGFYDIHLMIDSDSIRADGWTKDLYKLRVFDPKDEVYATEIIRLKPWSYINDHPQIDIQLNGNSTIFIHKDQPPQE